MSTKERKLKEKENRKEHILNAAFSVMELHGMHGFNIDLLAKETELAKGTIYLYFKNKEEILSVLSHKSRLLLLEKFKKIKTMNLSAIEQLKQVVKENYYFYKQSPLNYNLISLYEADNNLIETPEITLIGKQISEEIMAMVHLAQSEGKFNPNIDPMNFTFCLWGFSMGIIQLINIRGDLMKAQFGLTEESLIDNFLQTLEFGITK